MLLPNDEQETPTWCINCLPGDATIVINRSDLAGSAARRQLVLRGRSVSPGEGCIQTQLLVDDAPVDWWPTDKCASTTKDGRWRLNVPLYGGRCAPAAANRCDVCGRSVAGG